MNVLIIGLGSIGKRHCTVLKEINSSVEIYALRSSENADKLESVNNICSIGEIDLTPDFAIISNPTANHLDSIELCLDLNCPLFIEKPLSYELEKAANLLPKIEENGTITYVGCNFRFHPCLEFVKNYLENNSKINEVNVYCGSYLPSWRPDTDFRKSYSAIDTMGGGVHLDLIHEIDFTSWLFGQPESSQKLLRSVSTLDISSVDYASYRLVYPNFVANIVLNYYRKTRKRTLEIIFENNVLEVDLVNNTVSENDTIIFQEDLDKNYTYKKQLLYFIDCIQSGRTPMNSYKEALAVLKICLD